MSREKQIELLEKQLAFWKHHSVELSRQLTKEEEIANHYAEMLDKTEEELNAERVKSEWISVDERLPEREGTYLTYTDKDKMIMDVFCIYPSHGTKFWVGGNGNVTHWMPLPEAPKMKGGAE